MKRVSELEENAKRVRAEADAEIARIKATESFIPLLNADLAEWKAKLQDKATPTGGTWKLVIYADEDHSPLHYARRDYDPDIFSSTPWLVEKWDTPFRCSGRPVVVATANSPEDLLPSTITRKRLALFRLPFVVCPTTLEHPKKMEKLWSDIPGRFYAFGIEGMWNIDRIQSALPSVDIIQDPNLNDPQHVQEIYRWWDRDGSVSSNCVQTIEKLKVEREALCTALDEKIALCKGALELRNRLLE